ncbi:nucleoside monophosphate kinase [Micromonospora sp. WMMD998]|uniref:adenylate kinase family protein n=1 Tax=Micromonospora sp. WMMD998 TaxID=3016092 RepID=UPI00249A5FAE|nr:nucleoside monophosphate kinase [Micromonospora sp. WMMD998]WFE42617.1 nucleoside monophosphate kinase [Micromonospora sp. WMMD998]
MHPCTDRLRGCARLSSDHLAAAVRPSPTPSRRVSAFPPSVWRTSSRPRFGRTPRWLQARQHMDAGELVPVRVLLAMIRGRLTQPDVVGGFVLDGFPNHVVTAEALDALLSDLSTPLDRAIDLVLPDTEVLHRLAGRRTCHACGKPWQTEITAPTPPEVCERCGGELFQRVDDHPNRITAGLQSYRSTAEVTLNHYRALGKLTSTDATLTPAEITDQALA